MPVLNSDRLSESPVDAEGLKRSWAELLVRSGLDCGDPVGVFSRFLNGPKWQEKIKPEGVLGAWKSHLGSLRDETSGLSVCLQIPYGDKKCDFCNCPVKIREDAPSKVAVYLDDIKREIDFFSPLFKGKFPRNFVLRGLSSLFSQEQLADCLSYALSRFDASRSRLRFIEFEPYHATKAKLDLARGHGFNLVGFRVQPLGSSCRSRGVLKQAMGWARQAGFDRINVDLVLGLTSGAQAELLHNLKPIAELKPTAISMHRLTFADLYAKKAQARREENEMRYRSGFLRESEENEILAGIAGWGYVGMPWIPLQRRWIVRLKEAGGSVVEELQDMVPFEGGPVSYLGLGQFSRSVVGSMAYERYLVREFQSDRSLYRCMEIDPFERMMHYIVSSLETYSRVDLSRFKSCFGRDIRDSFGEEILSLERLGKIRFREDSLIFLAKHPKEKVFYELFFLTKRLPKIYRAMFVR